MKGINKYLFLDVDGVLNSVSWYREEWNKNHAISSEEVLYKN